jgi:hypothetical protein
MTQVKTDQAQCQVAEAKRVRAAKRRLRKDSYLDFRPYCAEILRWAVTKGASKAIVQDLLRQCIGITVSKDRVYRFVVSEIGKWPNGRKTKSPEKKNA